MKNLAKFAFTLAMILTIGILAQSCKTGKDTSKNDYPGENTPNIAGTWILKSLNGQDVKTIFKGVIPTMTIDAAEKRIFGNSGCNNYTGTYNYSEGILSAPQLASTMMACMEDNKEYQYLQVLGQSNKVSLINGTTLTLSNNGTTVAEFIKGIDLSRLSGEWKLESIAGGDTKALFADQIPTMTFDFEENRLGGNAGCNRYNATYTIKGAEITVGPVMSTRMACPNMEGEAKYTNSITGTSTLEVSTSKIFFMKEGKAILTFTKGAN